MSEQVAEQGQMNLNFLDFEQPIAELEAKIEELRKVGNDSELNISEEISRLQERARELAGPGAGRSAARARPGS